MKTYRRKRNLTSGVQFLLLFFMAFSGFWNSYLWVWKHIHLPAEWYSLVFTGVLALVSIMTLISWIGRTEVPQHKKET